MNNCNDHELSGTKQEKHPFRGRSRDDKKRLFAYMIHLAHPCFSAEEIIREWGDDIPLEALEFVEHFKRETPKRTVAEPVFKVIRRMPIRGWIAVLWVVIRLDFSYCGPVSQEILGMRSVMRQIRALKFVRIREEKEPRTSPYAQCALDAAALLNAAAGLTVVMREEREPRTELFMSGIKYLNSEDFRPIAAVIRPTELMTLDLDPGGAKTVAWGRALTQGLTMPPPRLRTYKTPSRFMV